MPSVPASQQAVASATETDRLIAALEPILARQRSFEHRQSLELLKAVRLAPSLELCEALLRGERVPRSWLDERWVKAYGAGGQRRRS